MMLRNHDLQPSLTENDKNILCFTKTTDLPINSDGTINEQRARLDSF